MFRQGSMMRRVQQRNSSLLFLRSACILVTMILSVCTCRGGGLSESKSLIQFIQAIDPNNALKINYKGQVPYHCSAMWPGIKCDMRSLNITEIRLEKQKLDGIVDVDSLCKLASLQVLNLARNLVHGVIPESISKCHSLTYLNLSSNLLNGTVPTSLTSLKNLTSLDISNNNLTGTLPQFDHTIELFYTHTMMRSSISNSKNDTSVKDKSENDGTHLKVELKRVITFLYLLIIALFFMFVFFTDKSRSRSTKEKKTKDRNLEIARELTVGTEQDREEAGEQLDLVFFSQRYERFSVDDLLKSEADLQGQNFYSTLFKVRLTDSAIFAVKRLKNLQVSEDEFRSKVTWLGNLAHPNILPLVAFNSSENEKLLVYRYQKNDSLSSLLSSYTKKEKDFPWRQRLSIMSGIARGLEYVASKSTEAAFIHGNLKPSNIMLSDSDEPLISEFGIWGFLEPKKTFIYSSNGYRAPERRLTKEADIFSFGVILLQLLTGKIVEKGGVNLPKWVKSMVREEWTGEVLDIEVRKVAKQWAFPLLNVALRCVSDLPECRPDISEILEKIEHVIISQEDWSLSSASSGESNQQDHLVLTSTLQSKDLPGIAEGESDVSSY